MDFFFSLYRDWVTSGNWKRAKFPWVTWTGLIALVVLILTSRDFELPEAVVLTVGHHLSLENYLLIKGDCLGLD